MLQGYFFDTSEVSKGPHLLRYLLVLGSYNPTGETIVRRRPGVDIGDFWDRKHFFSFLLDVF